MRNTLLLIFIVVFQAYAGDSYSQYAKLTLNLSNVTVAKVLEEIENNSEFYFLFNSKLIDVERKVSISMEDKKLSEILTFLFKGTDVHYTVYDKQIILTQGDVTTLSSSMQEQKQINGIVTDKDGNALPGVNVVVTGLNLGVITDSDGKYRIEVPQNARSLTFSFIGMESQEIPVGTSTQINVSMVVSSFNLEEVVVIGYGTVKKSDLTGTVSSVTTEKTIDIPNTNVLQSLQGSVAGLNVVTPDHAGENIEVTIRGLNSLSASNSPLIVVDGIIYNGSLNDFNVNDIEKIDVLKDASAAAVYGARSSNGVIILTTKMGSSSKPIFNFNSYYGISDPVYLIPMKDGPGYIQKVLDFRKASGMEADPSKIEDYISLTEAENYRNGKTIDWYDKMIKQGVTENYNLNVSGKSNNTSYYLSGAYFKQEGIVANDNFKRMTIMANFTNKITDWYSVSLRTGFSSKDYSGIAESLNYGLSPYGTYWENESKGIYKVYPMEDPYFTNPMIPTLIDNKDIRTSILGVVSSELQLPFVKGLKWTLNYSANLLDQKVSNFYNNTIPLGPSGTLRGTTLNGIAEKDIYDNYNWTLDNIINYNKKFLDVHSVDITLLYSREYLNYEATTAEGTNFFNQALGYNNLSLAQVQQIGSDYQEQNSVAYMARLNYIYKNKYLLTATIRKDGFSGFGQNNKYATFPSMAFAWTASNETFMKNLKWLNFLKFRISYGKNGNQALGRYQTLARISNSQYLFGDGGSTVTTSYLTSMANNDLGWESTKVKNIGVDFGVFKNILNGSIDVYSSSTFNILLLRNLPSTSGYPTVWTNIGEVHNQGVEFTMNSVNLKRSNLIWQSGFTFSLNRNRIVHLFSEDLDGDGIEDDDIANSWFIGKPLGVIYGYKTDGIYQLTDINIPTGFKPGDFRLVDTNKDGQITPEDRTILGSTLPNYIFSISNSIKYKNFSLYVLINSIQGGGKDNYYIGNNYAMHTVNYPFTDWSARFNIIDVPYWTPDNPSNTYSRIDYIPSRAHPYIEDRSFVRLQDVNISYTFGSSALEKIHLQELRLYISGKNLYTWRKWTGYDPENMTTIGNFPMLRTFTIGADLKF